MAGTQIHDNTTSARLRRTLRLACVGLLLSALAGSCGPRRAGPKPFNPRAVAKQATPDRDFWQMPAVIVSKMGIRPGMQVIDLGAGTGYMLPWLSKAVGPKGKVYAAESQPALVDLLEKRVKREGLTNVEVVLSTATNVPIAGVVDRVLLLDTYSELSAPIIMLSALRLRLKGTGRLAVIDTLPFADIPGPPMDERLSLDTVIAEARGAGFVESLQFKVLPRQYFAMFINFEETDARVEPDAPEVGLPLPPAATRISVPAKGKRP